MDGSIQQHNLKAANTWSAPRGRYDEISRTIADAIEHAIDRLQPRPGERILDLACGTGWASRSIATRVPRTHITGADISEGLLEAARTLAASNKLPIDYQLCDAEKLPFPDGTFDAVISTFGVMFAGRPEAAAAELARVVKTGGRIALATWKPDSALAEMFGVMKKYMPPPPATPPPSPFAWGAPERVKELLGSAFELGFEEGTNHLRLPSGEAAWQLWLDCYGPTQTLAGALNAERQEQFKRDMIGFHERFAAPLGIDVPRRYMVTLGVRS